MGISRASDLQLVPICSDVWETVNGHASCSGELSSMALAAVQAGGGLLPPMTAEVYQYLFFATLLLWTIAFSFRSFKRVVGRY